MPSLTLLPVLSYVLIASFTPGPSNLSSSSLGMLYGLRRTLAYLAGLGVGVVVVMLAAGLLSAQLLAWFPRLEPVMRSVGAAYILYLAVGLLRAHDTGQPAAHARPLGFRHGLALQLTNPKVMVYAFTLFTSFLAPLAGRLALIVVAAVLLAVVATSAAFTWALCGSAIKRVLRHPRAARWINVVLALLLAVTAVDLAGVLG